MITGGDEVCILPPPTCLKKGWVYPLLSITQVNMYVCLVIMHYSKSIDQRGKVANSDRDQLNRENIYFPVPICLRVGVWTRKTGLAAPSRVSLAGPPHSVFGTLCRYTASA